MNRSSKNNAYFSDENISDFKFILSKFDTIPKMKKEIQRLRGETKFNLDLKVKDIENPDPEIMLAIEILGLKEIKKMQATGEVPIPCLDTPDS